MDRSEIRKMPQPIEAKTYYVQDDDFRWAFVTIAPAIGLVQVHSDYGSFSHRYEGFHGDFRDYLTRAEGIRDKFEGWWHGWNHGASQQLTRRMHDRLKTIMVHIWPLFIEKLKAELAGEVTP